MAQGYKGFKQIAIEADRSLKRQQQALELIIKFDINDIVQWDTSYNSKEYGYINDISYKDEYTPIANVISSVSKPVIPLQDLSIIEKAANYKEKYGYDFEDIDQLVDEGYLTQRKADSYKVNIHKTNSWLGKRLRSEIGKAFEEQFFKIYNAKWSDDESTLLIDTPIEDKILKQLEKVCLLQNLGKDCYLLKTIKQKKQEKEIFQKTVGELIKEVELYVDVFNSYPPAITDNLKIITIYESPKGGTNEFSLYKPSKKKGDKYIKFIHKEMVKQALAEGENIPEEVLKYYPDLKSKNMETKQKNNKNGLDTQTYIGDNPINDLDYAWEMKKLDYQQIKAIERTGSPMILNAQDGKIHEKIVKQALSDGKSVPKEVLNDYPWLKEGKKEFETENENLEVESRTNTLDLLKGGKWFEQNPDKILGEQYKTTDQFSKPVTKVKGTIENVMQGIDVPSINIPKEHTEALETDIKETLGQFLGDKLHSENVDEVIKQTQKEHAEKELKKLYKDSPDKTDKESMYSFEKIIEQYNKGITEEEIKVWLWYKRKTGGFNDEITILKQSSGWSKYIVPLGQVNKYFKEWLQTGIICYYNGDYIPSVLYYAENIYKRQTKLLAEKQEIIKLFGQSQYDRQWNGLENIKPPKLTLADPQKQNRLFIKPTSAFANEIEVGSLTDGTSFTMYNKDSGKYDSSKTTLVEAFKSWLQNLPKDEFKKSNDWNIKQYYIENRTPPRHYDKEEKLRIKQNAKQEGDQFFVRFLAEGLTREDQLIIEQLWNEKYNGYVPINYFKIPIGFNCSATFKNKPLFIRPAQREGIGFISVHGSGCIAYDVGVGKTMTAILSLAQALELGQCKRPFIVVPNQTYKNWLGELRGVVEKGKVTLTGVLPQYQINDLYNLGNDYLDELRDEDGIIQAVPEYSISVITYEGFNRLGFLETTENEIGMEIFEILNQGIEKEREKAKLWEKVETVMGKGFKGAKVNIETLGFDYMVADESHAMKKSFTQVKGEQKGDDAKRDKVPYEINSGQPSMTALRGFMISQYILRNNKMRNVLLLTATPFTNSPLEIYSVLALIGYQQLEQAGIKNIKEFFDTFIKTSLQLVINAKLKPERKEIIMGFSNLIALQSLIFKFINYKTGEDAHIQRPNKIVLPYLNKKEGGNIIALPPQQQVSTNLQMTPTQKEYMQDVENYVTGKTNLVNFCVNARGLEDTGNDEGGGELLDEKNLSDDELEGTRILRGMSFARQIALSPYLYSCNPDNNPTYEKYIETSPKLKYVMECIRSVKRFHEQRNEEVSGQVIYMNSGVHFFSLIKEYLVKKVGFAESEIGIIKSGVSAEKKEGIKERFLAGSVKVIIGSATIKEGINLQDNASTLYNCWLDWNPTDLKQLEGRIWRFGNRFANVRIVNPLMEDSIDSFIFQKLEEKTSRINEIWYRAGKTNALDLEEFNPSELKMGLVTDPYALAELLLMEERELLQDEINGLRNQITVLDEIKQAREDFNNNIEHVREAVNRYKPQKEGTKARTIETIFKLYRDYMEDENTETTYRDENIYDTVRKANTVLKRGLEQILQPKGFDVNFDYNKVVGKIEKEIEEIEKVLQERTGDDAKNKKAKEIIKEREAKGYKPKTIKERVEEFAKLNPKALTELMVYDGSEKGKEKIRRKARKGKILESTADKLEKIKRYRKVFIEMQKRLEKIQKLKAA